MEYTWIGLSSWSQYRCPSPIRIGYMHRNKEGARKDIDRAFGVLRHRFYILKQPIRLYDRNQLHKVALTCIILHNMIVEDEKKMVWKRILIWMRLQVKWLLKNWNSILTNMLHLKDFEKKIVTFEIVQRIFNSRRIMCNIFGASSDAIKIYIKYEMYYPFNTVHIHGYSIN